MSARKFCWYCGGGLWANRGRTIDHPSGPVVVHAACYASAKTDVGAMTGDDVTVANNAVLSLRVRREAKQLGEGENKGGA